MKISLRSSEVVVNPDDPFQNDMLDRKKSVEILTGLVANLSGACTLTVDAEWGHGKTTFLKLWSAHLRQRGFPVVEFNAWETDYSGNPFVTLSTELTDGLQKSADSSLSMKIQNFKKQAARVARRAVPTVAQGVGTFIPVVGTGLGQVAASLLKDNLSAYEENQQSVKSFKRILKDMAEAFSERAGGRPLIVMIDELDRCRPSYAVQLLEAAKHLFSVEHIVFVLAINRSELAHSVKALYGNGFDAAGYLRRFFDADFRLPHPNRDKFIEHMIRSTGIHDYFSKKELETAVTKELPKAFFRAPDLSLRTIAQAIHRLRWILESLPSGRSSLTDAVVVALIVRTIDADLYYRFFVRGELSDAEVVDRILKRPEADIGGDGRADIIFEASLIAAFFGTRKGNGGGVESPLLLRHKETASTSLEEWNSDTKRSQHIIQIFEMSFSHVSRDFEEAVERLELLADDLLVPLQP